MVGPIQNISTRSGNVFVKRDLVLAVRRFDPNTGEPITDNENTPQITFTGERCRELDNFMEGQMVSVSFDLTGRRFVDAQGQTKYFNDVRGYKIEPYGRAIASAPQSATQPQCSNPMVGTEPTASIPVYPNPDTIPF